MAKAQAQVTPWSQVTEIRLDPVGGVSGDMFIGAASDAWPDLQLQLEQILAAVPFPPGCSVRFGRALRGGISAATFQLSVQPDTGNGAHSFDDVRKFLAASGVPAEVSKHALGIYGLLAEAEAAVHGVPVDEVHFHEIGDWDSIADVVGAAVVIAAFPQARWYTQSLPIGSGSVATAHGRLPVPAPAAAWLMRGLRSHDDGIAGERVTPTGAAIVRYVAAQTSPTKSSLEFLRIGYGGGSKELPGLPNILRLLVFGSPASADSSRETSDSVAVIRFEVDDQTPEDLALGLDRLRALPGVLDVAMWSAQGKKGRMLFAVQVLAQEGHQQAIIEACLAETATIGVRCHAENRMILPRHESLAPGPAGTLRVKQVDRPGGQVTRKVEADDLAALGLDYAQRHQARRRAESSDDE